MEDVEEAKPASSSLMAPPEESPALGGGGGGGGGGDPPVPPARLDSTIRMVNREPIVAGLQDHFCEFLFFYWDGWF